MSDRDPVKALREAVAETHGAMLKQVYLTLDDARALLALIEVGETWAEPARGTDDPKSTMALFRSDWRAAKEGK